MVYMAGASSNTMRLQSFHDYNCTNQWKRIDSVAYKISDVGWNSIRTSRCSVQPCQIAWHSALDTRLWIHLYRVVPSVARWTNSLQGSTIRIISLLYYGMSHVTMNVNLYIFGGFSTLAVRSMGFGGLDCLFISGEHNSFLAYPIPPPPPSMPMIFVSHPVSCPLLLTWLT